MTQRAVNDLIDAVRAIPAEKVNWSPGGKGRSALHQLREVTVSATILKSMMDGEGAMSQQLHDEAVRHLHDSEHEDLDLAIAEARFASAELCNSLANFPDERLEDEIVLPFGAGISMTMADCLALCYWNATYHTGQINYILSLIDQEA